MSALPVIVTRPAREAGPWIDELRAAGLDARALPLIEIAPVGDAQPLRAAWRQLADLAALMFVSAGAVDHFFAQRPTPVEALPSGLRFWATGPGTARALQRNGVPREAIDVPADDTERFDSEALWAIVQPQVAPGTRVLIVRGGDALDQPTGRDWLARQIESVGGRCEAVVAYRRLPPAFDDAQRLLALEGAAGRAIWLFSSSEAVVNLVHAMPGSDWQAARAVATHARIGEAARHAGFGVVSVCTPLAGSLIASIESLA